MRARALFWFVMGMSVVNQVEARVLRPEDGLSIYNIQNQVVQINRDMLESRGSIPFGGDYNTDSCFHDLIQDLNVTFDLADREQTLIYISVNMSANADEALVNNLLRQNLKIDLGAVATYRRDANRISGLCSNNAFIVSRVQQFVPLLDALSSSFANVQRKLK